MFLDDRLDGVVHALCENATQEIIHTCSCRLTYDAASWAALPLVGYQAAEDPDELCELRNCSCTSTRAVRVPGPGYWLGRAVVRAQAAHASAQREMLANAQWEAEQAAVCLRQATELTRMLTEQRARYQLMMQAAE